MKSSISKEAAEVSAINHYRCHRVVELIRTQGIDFDTADLEEDLCTVLHVHGILESLTPEEIATVKQDLWPLALAAETVEIIRTIQHHSLKSDGEWQ